MVHCDAYDKLILSHLDRDARQSYARIGEKIHLPKSVVSYRVKKMVERGIIRKFYTVIDTYKLGFLSFRIYIAFQYTTPEIEKEIRNHFIHCPLNWVTLSTEGRFDLEIILWAKDIETFYSFWEKTLRKYRDYFRKQYFSLYLQSYEFMREYLKKKESKLHKTRKTYHFSGVLSKKNYDRLDYDILGEMANNARISYQQLSKILHTPASKIKHRIDKLIKDNIILGFRIDIDISKIGYRSYKADICLKNYEERMDIIHYIKMDPHLVRIDKSVGISDLELEFHVQNDGDFQHIMNELNTTFKNSIRNYKYLTTTKRHNISYIPY